jgi:peptidoglycan/LPS O-acetylase OafA/YrhL
MQIDCYEQILASLFFVQNWKLVYDKADYWGAGKSQTLVNHFWSLSVEEQFYIFAPLLLLLIFVLIKKFSKKLTLKKSIFTFLVICSILSLSFSAYSTNQNENIAYFQTWTRVWELALGGIVYLFSDYFIKKQINIPFNKVVALVGWLIAIVSCVTLNQSKIHFPGAWTLFPCLGTALVILANWNIKNRKGKDPLILRPFVFIGNISYSLYLWHFVVYWIVITAYIGTAKQKFIGVIVAIILATLSYFLIEKPVKNRNGFWTNKKLFVFVLIVYIVMSLFSTSSIARCNTINQNNEKVTSKKINEAFEAYDNQDFSNSDICFGALALEAKKECDNRFGMLSSDTFRINDFMTDSKTHKDELKYQLGRYSSSVQKDLPHGLNITNYGNPESKNKILLWGDSHAGAVSPAFGYILGTSDSFVSVATMHASKLRGCVLEFDSSYKSFGYGDLFPGSDGYPDNQDVRGCNPINQYLANFAKNYNTIIFAYYIGDDDYKNYEKGSKYLKDMGVNAKLFYLEDNPSINNYNPKNMSMQLCKLFGRIPDSVEKMNSPVNIIN